MKNITIFFLSIYLLGVTPLGELYKMPLLVSHYQKHQKQNKNLNFIDFLKIHYFNGDPKDSDYKEDMKLPFKSIEVNTSNLTYIIFETLAFKIKRPTYFELKIQKIAKSENWCSDIYLDSIWQPPRSIFNFFA